MLLSYHVYVSSTPRGGVHCSMADILPTISDDKVGAVLAVTVSYWSACMLLYTL